MVLSRIPVMSWSVQIPNQVSLTDSSRPLPGQTKTHLGNIYRMPIMILPFVYCLIISTGRMHVDLSNRQREPSCLRICRSTNFLFSVREYILVPFLVTWDNTQMVPSPRQYLKQPVKLCIVVAMWCRTKQYLAKTAATWSTAAILCNASFWTSVWGLMFLQNQSYILLLCPS